MSKYVVTIDNPYYPAVYYFDTLEDAQQRKYVLLDEMHEKDGTYDAKIIIAEIVEEQNIKTHF